MNGMNIQKQNNTRAAAEYALGAFLGMVSGFMVSKVYQTWAIVYRDSYYHAERLSIWQTRNPPLWVQATEQPTYFHGVTTGLFLLIALGFTWALRKR